MFVIFIYQQEDLLLVLASEHWKNLMLRTRISMHLVSLLLLAIHADIQITFLLRRAGMVCNGLDLLFMEVNP